MSTSNGRIELVVGPMFAGKTTELMRRVKREIHARKKCFVIKYSRDTRYNDAHVASHDKSALRANASVAELSAIGDRWRAYDVLAIDEGQFYPDLYDFATYAADAGKIVIISALDGDFMRKPFGRICELIPMCETVDKLHAVCMMCHEAPAAFTRRTVVSNEQELIGGADMYIAACRRCFNNPVPPSPGRMTKVREAIREVEVATLMKTPAPLPVTAPTALVGSTPVSSSKKTPAEAVEVTPVAAKKHRAESPP